MGPDSARDLFGCLAQALPADLGHYLWDWLFGRWNSSVCLPDISLSRWSLHFTFCIYVISESTEPAEDSRNLHTTRSSGSPWHKYLKVGTACLMDCFLTSPADYHQASYSCSFLFLCCLNRVSLAPEQQLTESRELCLGIIDFPVWFVLHMVLELNATQIFWPPNRILCVSYG